MHTCCNPVLHDMQALTASAVSCIDPVVSRLQAASAEVAVAKLLCVCFCVMTLRMHVYGPSITMYRVVDTETMKTCNRTY